MVIFGHASEETANSVAFTKEILETQKVTKNYEAILIVKSMFFLRIVFKSLVGLIYTQGNKTCRSALFLF